MQKTRILEFGADSWFSTSHDLKFKKRLEKHNSRETMHKQNEVGPRHLGDGCKVDWCWQRGTFVGQSKSGGGLASPQFLPFSLSCSLALIVRLIIAV
jgi:hypothetical protein